MLIVFISLPFLSFCQSEFKLFVPRFDSLELETLKLYGIYYNDVDQVEDRIDTLNSSHKIIFRQNEEEKNIIQGYNLITFYEYDNLLVINSDSNVEKKIIFLNFLYEMGENDILGKNYLSESGESITIKYKIDSSCKKIISRISIISDFTNDYIVSYCE